MLARPHSTIGLLRDAGPLSALSHASVAFQPIVDCATFRTYGFEALARLAPDSGFRDIHAVMDAAADRGQLRLSERLLLTRSISRFAEIPDASAVRLFCNVDNRVFDDPAALPADIVQIALQKSLSPANLCIELSEREAPQSIEALRRLVDQFMRFNVRLAIDDFGKGFSGLDMLLQVNPHYVKIDRAFVAGLGADMRRQAIVHKVTGLAHSLGLLVVAEGVENEPDLRKVRELGCDLLQGHLIAEPSVDLAGLRMSYDSPLSCTTMRGIAPQVADLVERVAPITVAATLKEATERFKSRSLKGILPVVDEHGFLHGAIYESDVGNFLFGDYGSALLANKGLDQSVTRIVRRCPMSDIHVSVEALVESYVVADGNEGLMLTAQGRYVGFLSNNSVLRLAMTRELEAARDQNPLTRLPGNLSIERHVGALVDRSGGGLLVYFDFDNFKAFNDKYGFAAGDRALLLFADRLKAHRAEHGSFAAHVGGDDFFLGREGWTRARRPAIEALCDDFARAVAALYTPEDRAAGGIFADDRFGQQRFFPMLRASAVLLELGDCCRGASPRTLLDRLAAGKSAAKKSVTGIAEVSCCAE